MRLSRMAAVVLMGSGMASWLAAVESSCCGVDCSETYYSPATCRPAYEEVSTNASANRTCVRSSDEECVPGGGSTCSGLIWGQAIGGECKLQPLGSTPYQCFKDTAVTVITLHQFGLSCADGGDTCDCLIEIDVNGSSEEVEVCDCRDEKI